VAIAWNKLTGRTHDIAGPMARAAAPRVEPPPPVRPENGGQRKRKPVSV
jgi:hypothetical protein